MNLLFICSRNKARSLTAENVFSSYPNIETKSAGVAKDADYVVSLEDIEWADKIICMEKKHSKKIVNYFKTKLKRKPIVVLHIPDTGYEYMDDRLVEILESKARLFIK